MLAQTLNAVSLNPGSPQSALEIDSDENSLGERPKTLQLRPKSSVVEEHFSTSESATDSQEDEYLDNESRTQK